MKSKYILTAATLSALALASCEDDFLNEEPKLKQSTEITLSNIDGIEKAISGSYAPLYGYGWYGSSFIWNCEMRACNARKPQAGSDWDSGRCKTSNDWSYSADATMSGLWSYAYYTIANVNDILDNVDGKADQEIVDGIRAEALFLRALAHFDLVRTFGQPYTQVDPTTSLGVPIMLHTVTGSPARNTVAEVYAQIVADLTEAESIIPEDYNTSDNYHQSAVADYKAVASLEAIQGLLSRVYLYMGEWQKSADYATKVINKMGSSKLWNTSNILTAYTSETGTSEVIFEVYGAEGNDRFSTQNWEFLMWLSSPRGSGDFGASHDVYDLYADNDVRKQLYTSDSKAVFGSYTQYWSTKYAGKDASSPSYNNTILIRLSEMYLNRAEAQIRGAVVSGTSAQSDMVTLASARGTQPEAATLNGIFKERRKELAFEGHIVYDYARFGYSLTRNDIDAELKEVPFPNYRWALPIPKDEIDANPSMVQNPGY